MPGGINPPTTGKRVVVKAVGGGVPDAPRGVTPPPLQATLKGVRRAACPQAAAGVSGWLPVDGGHSKVAGRACPAPTDCRESSCTRGAREGGSPPLPSWRVVDRKRAATQGPSGPFRPRKLGQLFTVWGAFCAGEARERSLPIRGGGRGAGRKGSAR